PAAGGTGGGVSGGHGERLEGLRAGIARIDESLVALLAERVALAREVGAVKRAAGLPRLDPAREAAVVRRGTELARGVGGQVGGGGARAAARGRGRARRGGSPGEPRAGGGARPPRPGGGLMRVAFQGGPGAFSESAAHQALGDGIETVPCRTFLEVASAVRSG